MSSPTAVQHPSYTAMGHGRHDYEPCYFFDELAGSFGYHCHDFYELYIHFSGADNYCVDNNVYPLQPNQLMIIPPFCLHGFIGDVHFHNYERAYVYVSSRVLQNAGCGQIDLPRLFGSYTDKGQYQFIMLEEDAAICKRLVQEMVAGLHDDTPMGRYANQVRLMSYLHILCQTVSRAQKKVEPIAVNDAMQEVLVYINDHFTQPQQLSDLARRFGMSVSLLSHEFVRFTGRSVYDYVLYRRVQLAKELITSGMQLNDVAYQCGFNDYSNFLRAFRRISDMSPSAYRKLSQSLAQQ